MCEWKLKFYMNLASQMIKFLGHSDGDEFGGVIKAKFYNKLQ